MLRVRGGVDPLLRRPLSIHRYSDGEIEFLFREKGLGTKILAGQRAGDALDILAPLGKGFRVEREYPILIGGGIGVAPLLYLAEDCLARGLRPKLLLGGRTDRDILCHGEFSCINVPAIYSTEDGSLGETGLVTELLLREIEARDKTKMSVHACGPVPMLAALARICEAESVPCEVSLEAHMACGVGACLGCVVKGRDGKNLRVCKEGPVFDSREINWG
jgi:dihydroorotate dehydrogenase electron transfer subunit